MSKDWNKKPFDELFEIRSDSYRPEEKDETVFHYSMPAFDNGKPVKEHTSEINSTKRIVPDKTILFPKLNIRKKRFWFVDNECDLPKVCSTEYWPLLPKTEEIFLPFYHQYFQSDIFCDSPLLSTSSSTNSHQRVKRNLVKLEELPIPPRDEQERIASVLYTVDSKVEVLNERYDNLTRLKQALMQDLLTGDTRVTPETPVLDEVEYEPSDIVDSEWKSRDIKDAYIFRDSERQPLNQDEREQKRNGKEGTIPYYGANGVVDYIDEYIFDEELILVAEDGGHFEEYQTRPIAYMIDGKSWVNNHAHVLEAKEGVNMNYGFYTLEHKNLLPYVNGSSRPKLTKGNFKLASIDVPPKWEQERIASVLYTVDEMIAKTEKLINKYEDLKRGLMQDLLSGDVRTPKELDVMEEVMKS